MLLAVNVGNTNTSFGFFDKKKLLANWKLPTSPKRTKDEYGALLQQFFSQKHYTPSSIAAVVIGSVVPTVTPKIEAFVKQTFLLKPIFVSTDSKLPIKLAVDNPNGVGLDIIANAVAANEYYSGEVIVVDFGTATTFNVFSGKGIYTGSVIAPGLDVMTNYLSQRTALLPEVSFTKPQTIIGKNTKDCMASGIFYGYIGLVESILTRIKAEHKKAKVIATGGNCSLLAGEISGIYTTNPNLTLEGLRIIYQNVIRKK